MEITINLVEAASELAHNAAKDEMINDELISEEDQMWLLEDEMNNYTDQAQKVHNRWYDYFWNEIEKCKI